MVKETLLPFSHMQATLTGLSPAGPLMSMGAPSVLSLLSAERVCENSERVWQKHQESPLERKPY